MNALRMLFLGFVGKHVELYLRERMLEDLPENHVMVGTLRGVLDTGWVLDQDTDYIHRRVFVPAERVAYVAMPLSDEEPIDDDT